MHVHVTLTDQRSLDHLTRVVARLHAARIEPAELHLIGQAICIQVASAGVAERVGCVLRRVVGVGSVTIALACPSPVSAPPVRTTYVPYIRPVKRSLTSA